MQNGYIERFNRTYRENVLDSYIFESLEDVREITDEFVKDYNEERPHESLAGLSPCEIQRKWKTETCCFNLTQNKILVQYEKLSNFKSY